LFLWHVNRKVEIEALLISSSKTALIDIHRNSSITIVVYPEAEILAVEASHIDGMRVICPLGFVTFPMNTRDVYSFG